MTYLLTYFQGKGEISNLDFFYSRRKQNECLLDYYAKRFANYILVHNRKVANHQLYTNREKFLKGELFSSLTKQICLLSNLVDIFAVSSTAADKWHDICIYRHLILKREGDLNKNQCSSSQRTDNWCLDRIFCLRSEWPANYDLDFDSTNPHRSKPLSSNNWSCILF